jgi:hypothetical protein
MSSAIELYAFYFLLEDLYIYEYEQNTWKTGELYGILSIGAPVK